MSKTWSIIGSTLGIIAIVGVFGVIGYVAWWSAQPSDETIEGEIVGFDIKETFNDTNYYITLDNGKQYEVSRSDYYSVSVGDYITLVITNGGDYYIA